MLVKIGDTVHDSAKEPICLTLSDKEHGEIADLPADERLYCCYPAGRDKDEIVAWMQAPAGDVPDNGDKASLSGALPAKHLPDTPTF